MLTTRTEILAEGIAVHMGFRDVLPTLARANAIVPTRPMAWHSSRSRTNGLRMRAKATLRRTIRRSLSRPSLCPPLRLHSPCAQRRRHPRNAQHFLYPAPDAIGGIFNPNGAGSGRWGFECLAPVLYYGKDPYLATGQGRRPNSWEQPANDYAEKNGHPCPKPIGMMRWLVQRASLPGETVLGSLHGQRNNGRRLRPNGAKIHRDSSASRDTSISRARGYRTP